MESVCDLLGGNCIILVAAYYDRFRKPCNGMFQYLQELVVTPLTRENTFFCGDMFNRTFSCLCHIQRRRSRATYSLRTTVGSPSILQIPFFCKILSHRLHTSPPLLTSISGRCTLRMRWTSGRCCKSDKQSLRWWC